MNWVNLEIAIIRRPEYVGCEPVQRATWFNVLVYCCEQENGGRIAGAAGWKDRRWEQTCGVTAGEVSAAAPLLTIEGGDVLVWQYPAAKQRLVQQRREAGERGGRARGFSKARLDNQNASKQKADAEAKRKQNASNKTQANAREGNGKEGNGKEEEAANTTRAAAGGAGVLQNADAGFDPVHGQILVFTDEQRRSDTWMVEWENWCQYQKERGKYAFRTLKAQLEELTAMGIDKSLDAMRNAIKCGLIRPALPFESGLASSQAGARKRKGDAHLLHQ
jgi:hypothetical protein